MQSFSEILKHYPEFPEGRRQWLDRVYFDVGKGRGLIPLTDYDWDNGGPIWLRMAIKTLAFLGSPKMRPIFGMVRKKRDRVPKDAAETNFETPNLEDITPSLSSDAVS